MVVILFPICLGHRALFHPHTHSPLSLWCEPEKSTLDNDILQNQRTDTNCDLHSARSSSPGRRDTCSAAATSLRIIRTMMMMSMSRSRRRYTASCRTFRLLAGKTNGKFSHSHDMAFSMLFVFGIPVCTYCRQTYLVFFSKSLMFVYYFVLGSFSHGSIHRDMFFVVGVSMYCFQAGNRAAPFVHFDAPSANTTL